MPYEPPIEIISNMMNGLVSQIEEQRENQIVATIREQYHVECDREELIKALNYDRQQYEKGFNDARMRYANPIDLQDVIHNYLLSHEVSELLNVVLKAVEEYER